MDQHLAELANKQSAQAQAEQAGARLGATLKKVVIESPFGRRPGGYEATPEDYEEHTLYAQRCVEDSLRRGEAPFASHLLYPQVLNDTIPGEREGGMRAGLAWSRGVDRVVYTDYGVTEGMEASMEASRSELGVNIYIRSIGKNLVR